MSESRVVTDSLSLQLMTYYVDNSRLVEQWREGFSRHSRDVILAAAGGEHRGAEAASALDRALQALCASFPLDVFKRKHIYYWLAIERRRSCLWLKTRFDDPASAALSKFYMNNLIYAHGDRSPVSPVVPAEDHRYEFSDFALMYRLEVLGSYLQRIATNRRMCAKGAGVRIDGQGIAPLVDERLARAFTRYDRKRQKVKGLLHLLGLLNRPLESPALMRPRNEFLYETIPNAFHGSFQTEEITYDDPNVWPQIFPLEPMEAVLDHLGESFRVEIGLSFKTWLRILGFVSSFLSRGDRNGVVNQLLRTGYALRSRQALFDAAEAESVCAPEELMRFLEHASFGDHTPPPGPLSHVSGFFVLPVGPDSLLIDGERTQKYFFKTVTDVYRSVRANDEESIGKIRGDLLELQVEAAVRDSRRKLKLQMPFPRGQKFRKGGSPRVEVDVTVAAGDLLILIDCKSVLGDPGLDEGDFAATGQRVEKLRGLLERRDTLNAWLAENPVGDNYDIRKYARCVSLLMSSDVEWLPPEDPLFWWKDGLPRIMAGEFLGRDWEKLIKTVDFGASAFSAEIRR